MAFYKIATSDEPAFYTSEATDFNRTPLWKAIAARVTGHDSNAPIVNGFNSGSSSVSSLAVPSLTTTTNNNLLVAAATVRSAISSLAAPGGMTQQLFLDGVGVGDNSTNAPSLFAATEVIATAGSTGSKNFTWSGAAQATGLMFAIAPDPVNVDLSIELNILTPEPHHFADEIEFEIKVKNRSTEQDATDVVVNFMLPEGFGYVSHTTSQGSCVPHLGYWTVGTLAKGATATNNVRVVIACDEVNYSGNATIISKEYNINQENNTAYLSIEPEAGGANPCPVIANDDIAVGLQGQPLVINVLNNDKGDYDWGKFSITQQPTNGTLQIGTNGQITYLPNGDYFGQDQFTYEICDSSGSLCDDAIVYVTIEEDITSPCLEANRSKTFYLPFPDNDTQLIKALRSSASQDPTSTSNRNIKSILSIKVPYPKTIIVYDHWEDGYESDITVPTQSTTQIWGDGDLSNGVAPGYPDDIIPAGGYIIFDQTFPMTRSASNIQYDGKDKLFSSNNVTISKVTGAANSFSVQNVKTDVLDISRFGRFFRVGIGEDFTSFTAFRYVGVFIRAANDNTFVEIDYNGDGIVDVTKTLNEGEVWLYDGTASATGDQNRDTNKANDIKANATITASEPVGVDVVFGGIDNYGTRNIYLLPSKFNSSEYITPVHQTNSSVPVVAFFTNPSSSQITVQWRNGDANNNSGSFNIPDNSYASYTMTGSSAYHFKSTNNEPFTAMVAIDVRTSGNSSAFDWAYPMVPMSQLTNYASIAWAPGSDNGTANYNPIWVTALNPTTVYVKWDGNMTDRNAEKYTDCGLPYDVAYPITALQSLKIRNSATNDQTGAAVFTCGDNPEPIVAVWGQDPQNGDSATPTASPAMDVGYAMQPACLNNLIVANDDFTATEMDTPVMIDVSANDGGFLTTIDKSSIIIVAEPDNGTVVVNGDGTISYYPNEGFVGEDYFEYSICSEEFFNTCDVATVRVNTRNCESYADVANANIVKGRVNLHQTNNSSGNYTDEDRTGGVIVDLYIDKNKDGKWDSGDEYLESTTTDIFGNFSFETLGSTYAKDEFTTAGQYNGNNGTVNWTATSWTRSGTQYTNSLTTVADPTPENETNVALRFAGPSLTASRSLNIPSATTTVLLRFKYKREQTSTGAIIDVQMNGNSIFEIKQSDGIGVDLLYQEVVVSINLDYINKGSANTLSFSGNGSVTTNDRIFIDDVELVYLPAKFIVKVSDGNTDYEAYGDALAYSFDDIGECTSYTGNELEVKAVIIANTDNITIGKDKPEVINVLSNDIGKPDPSTLTIIEEPENGSVVVNPDGSITYTPNPGYEGADSFKYSVCSIEDPEVCDEAEVIINVQCAFVPGKNVINGLVFGDVNLDGVYDAGESGIEGINVELYDNSNNLLQTVQTGELGDYQFEIDCETTHTVRDEFSTRVYNRNDGTDNWSGSWTEDGDGGNSSNYPTNGNIQVTTDGKLRVAGNGATSQISIRRTANLSGAKSATLSFDFNKSSFSNATTDWVDIEISKDGTNFTQLKRYSGTSISNGSDSFDISTYISDNTTIRFIESNQSTSRFSTDHFSTTEYVEFDNVQIEYIKISTDTKQYKVQLPASLEGYNTTSTPEVYNVELSGCGDASCSNNFGLAASDLSVTKTVDNDEPFVNDEVEFTITVKNYGPSYNSSIIAIDELPTGFEYISDDGEGAYDNSTGKWAIGTLAVNDSVALKIRAKVLAEGEFTNTASILESELPDPNPDNNEGSSIVSPEAFADVSVDKINTANPIVEGAPFSYIITVKNNGPSTAQGINVTDYIDPRVDVISASATQGTWSEPAWEVGDLAKDASATLTIYCVVPPNSGFSNLINTATALTDTYDRDLENNTSTISTKVVDEYKPGMNNPPIAVDDYYTMKQGNGSLEGNILKNDSDPDNDGLTLSQITVLDTNGEPAYITSFNNPVDIHDSEGNKIGELTINDKGAFTFTITDNDFTGQVPAIPYEVCDNGKPKECDDAKLIINVLEEDDWDNAIIANNDYNSAIRGHEMEGNVLENDEPAGKDFVLKSISYIDENGITQTVDVTEDGIEEDIYVIDENNNKIKAGTLEVKADGDYIFTPEPNFIGNVIIGQTVCDAIDGSICDNAILSLSLLPIAIQAKPDINQTPMGKMTEGNILSNDRGDDIYLKNITILDSSGNYKVVSVIDGGVSEEVYVFGEGGKLIKAGDITIDKNGKYSFTPTPSYKGNVPVEYQISNKIGSKDNSTLNIEVVPNYNYSTNNPPIANNDEVRTKKCVTAIGNVLSNDSDPDVEDNIRVTKVNYDGTNYNVSVSGTTIIVEGKGKLIIKQNGSFTFEPEENFVGDAGPFVYTVCDDASKPKCTTAELTVSVIHCDENNTFANDDANAAPQGVLMTGDVLENDFDPEETDTQKLTAIIIMKDDGSLDTISVPEGGNLPSTKIHMLDNENNVVEAGEFVVNADGEYTFTPNEDFVGTVVVGQQVCDSGDPTACDYSTLYLTSLGSSNYWFGGEDNLWNKAINWTGNKVPGENETVEFATEENNGEAAINDLHVPPTVNGEGVKVYDLINESNKALIVPAGASIIVSNEVVGFNTASDINKLRIKASDDGETPNGTFIALDACDKFDVYGTIELFAQGKKVPEESGDEWTDAITGTPTPGAQLRSTHTWQQFGIPVDRIGSAASTFNDSWIQEYSEERNDKYPGAASGLTNTFYAKWKYLETYDPLDAFKGYQITQDEPRTYTVKGKLNFCDKKLELTRIAEYVNPSGNPEGINQHYGLGQNIFGNSYTAAINVKEGIQFDAAEEVERVVYLYRTGSFQDWGNEGGLVTTYTKPNAGSYIAIPTEVAGEVWGNQIPSMQGFLLKFTEDEMQYGKDAAYVTLKYIDGGVVANTKPQLAQREPLSYLTVTMSSKSTVDRVWLFSQEGTSDEFDNGWDGRKYYGTPTAFIYSESKAGPMQVNTTDNLDGQVLSIYPNKDKEYTLTIEKNNLGDYDDLHLIDLVTRQAIALKDDVVTYNFTASHAGYRSKRFVIANGDINLDKLNSLDGYLQGNNQLVISNLTSRTADIRLHDISGKLLLYEKVKPSMSYFTVDLLSGVYILNMEAGDIRESVKLIVK